jgi:hypothetical protein
MARRKTTAVADPLRERDREKHRKLMAWFQQELRRQACNRFQMAIDEDYYDSEHYTAEEVRVMQARRQAPVVYNETKSTVDWLLGTERRTRVDFKVFAREESPDADADAECKTKLLKYLADVNRSEFERSYAADDCFKAGVGWTEIGISADPEDELIFHRQESWRNILYDSLSRRRDLEDATYLFRFRAVDLDVAIAYFPDKEQQLRKAATEQANDHYLEWWNNTPIEQALGDFTPLPGRYTLYDSDAWTLNPRDRVMLIEAWYREPTRETVGVGVAAVDRVRMKMRCAIMTEFDLLMDVASPYRHNRFPFVPHWCYRRKKDNAPYGVIRSFRGPQDSLNKRMSKTQHILSSSQLIAENDAFDDEIMTAEEAREEFSKPDGLVLLARGGMNKIKPDRQNDVADGHIKLAQTDAAMIRNAGGVTNENLGRDTNAQSGIAVQKKVEQGGVVTAEIFDNMLFARQIEGEIKLSLIEQYYTEPKVVSITGERAKRQYVRINQMDPATGQILNDVTAFKADFVIGEQAWKQTLQQAAAESLMELLQQLAPSSPEIVLALLDVAVELFDLPNKSLVLQRIRAVTGQADPDNPEDPAATAVQAAKQQQQQRRSQLEDDAIATENALKHAKTALANAQASQTQADMVLKRITSMFSAIQAAQVVQTIPGVSATADELLGSAGQVDQNTAPFVPEAQQTQAGIVQPAHQNTSPMFPPHPQAPEVGVTSGIEGGQP